MSTPTPEERARALYRRLFQLPGNADTRQADIAAAIREAERAAALAMRERCAAEAERIAPDSDDRSGPETAHAVEAAIRALEVP